MIYKRYPAVPAGVVKSLTQGYTGNEACKSVGTIFGVQNVMEIKVFQITTFYA